MNIYDKIGDVNINIKINCIAFNILLTKSFFLPGSTITSINHNHSLYEVHFLDSGNEELLVCEKKTIVLPNTYFLIGPGVYHAHKYTDDMQQHLRTYCLRFDFKETDTTDSHASVTESREMMNLLFSMKYFYAADTDNCIALIQEILEEFENQWFGYYARIQSLCVQIITNLLRDVSSEKQSKNNFIRSMKEDPRSEIIERFFSKNYCYDTRPVHLAKCLNVSHSQMNRILKKLYNISFKQKLLETRIEIAKDLLMADETSIHTIAEKVGYSEASSFCNSFKSKTGISPTDYRLIHQQTDRNRIP